MFCQVPCLFLACNKVDIYLGPSWGKKTCKKINPQKHYLYEYFFKFFRFKILLSPCIVRGMKFYSSVTDELFGGCTTYTIQL